MGLQTRAQPARDEVKEIDTRPARLCFAVWRLSGLVCWIVGSLP